MEHLDFILKFEEGTLASRDELVAGFQELIDDGTCWNLQSTYGRVALQLLGSGECLPASRLRLN